jgi:hypothetical protein
MYHRIVKRTIRKGYEQISRAEFEPLLKQFAPNIHFTFAGEHAMAADVHTRDSVRLWFERVHRIFPGLQIEADEISVTGFPWNTVAAVRFSVQDTLPDGTLYRNKGIQYVRIVWGNVVEDYLIEDTQLLANTLRCLAEHGVADSSAQPIHD